MKDEKLLKKIAQLSEKYSATGQDIYSFLEGLLYSDYMGYWDYIHLDTLLSLQNPKTDFPDEQIFIIYHQITELYFKLCLSEIEQINKNGKKILNSGEDLGWNKKLSVELFIDKLQRINRYLKHLIHSFEIMVSGMEKDQFLKFRMALLPSSGFQSVQYRMIELRSTYLKNLIPHNRSTSTKSISTKFDHLYWKLGARDLKSGKKSYTLLQFEKKYQERLLKLANKAQNMNLWQKYISLNKVNQKNEKLIQLMRDYDTNINVNWKLAHYKAAAKYLKRSSKDIAATGGTNWQKYLPPTFQKIIFYPELWTIQEKKEWGKEWVKSII